MRIRKKLKRPARIANYSLAKETEAALEQIRLMRKLGISIENNPNFKSGWEYKFRYC